MRVWDIEFQSAKIGEVIAQQCPGFAGPYIQIHFAWIVAGIILILETDPHVRHNRHTLNSNDAGESVETVGHILAVVND